MASTEEKQQKLSDYIIESAEKTINESRSNLFLENNPYTVTKGNQKKELKYSDIEQEIVESVDKDRQFALKGALVEQQKHLEKIGKESGIIGEANTGVSNIASYATTVMPMVRRVFQENMLMDLVPVVPASGPEGRIFTLKRNYGTDADNSSISAGDEADYVNFLQQYSQLATSDNNVLDNTRLQDFDTIDPTNGKSRAESLTQALEFDGGKEMTIKIIKKLFSVQTRKLKSHWSPESQEDAMNLHGIDVGDELKASMADEIWRGIDQEGLSDLRSLAGSASTFDFTDADGRNIAERYASIAVHLGRLSNLIAQNTKRGPASWAVINSDMMTPMLYANTTSFESVSFDGVAPSYRKSTMLGKLNGNMTVYVDLEAGSSESALLGYKGSSLVDNAYFFFPYVTLAHVGPITRNEIFTQEQGVRTRYGKVAFNDSNDTLNNSSNFYEKTTISNLSYGDAKVSV